MKNTLVRLVDNEVCTFGVLVIDNIPALASLELPWCDNLKRVSCIPAGSYKCSRIESEKHGDTYLINDVPERSEIIFHVGNFASDSEGCILLGCGWSAKLNEQPAIKQSKRAMELFREYTRAYPEFDLDILKVY